VLARIRYVKTSTSSATSCPIRNIGFFLAANWRQRPGGPPFTRFLANLIFQRGHDPTAFALGLIGGAPGPELAALTECSRFPRIGGDRRRCAPNLSVCSIPARRLASKRPTNSSLRG